MKNEACLPNMDDLFDSIQGSKFFSKLYLHSGYNQVRIRESDIPKSAKNQAHLFDISSSESIDAVVMLVAHKTLQLQ